MHLKTCDGKATNNLPLGLGQALHHRFLNHLHVMFLLGHPVRDGRRDVLLLVNKLNKLKPRLILKKLLKKLFKMLMIQVLKKLLTKTKSLTIKFMLLERQLIL